MSISNNSPTSLTLTLSEHGQDLTNLLNKLKPTIDFVENNYDVRVRDTIVPEMTSNDNVTQVEVVVKKMMEELEKADEALVQESRDYVIAKIKAILKEFVEFDPTNSKRYGDILTKVKSSKPKVKYHHTLLHPSKCFQDVYQPKEEDSSFHDKYDKLDKSEKQCLSLFSLFPDGSELNRRDVINWWVGSEFIENVSGNVWEEGKKNSEDIIENLMRKGFILKCWSNKKERNSYKICSGLHSKLKSKSATGAFQDMDKILMLEHEVDDKRRVDKIQAVFNISRNDLNNTVSSLLSKMKEVKLVHLGKWKNDRSYVTVEDIDDLTKAIKNLGHVRYLCLRGISGLVRLPSVIYKLKNLKVLDLRACHNLESLPQGISSLDQLVHLDLSECYLLDHIPKDVAKLLKLRVLMGFIVIKPDSITETRKRSKINKNVLSACEFSELSKLKQLRKLTIRSRSVTFPTEEDLKTVNQLTELIVLGLTWVHNPTASSQHSSIQFPSKLHKLELQAVSHNTATRLLRQIARTKLRKLYIRGGELENFTGFDRFESVEDVRLRYLQKLDVDWIQFTHLFPNLLRLEVLGCPNLIDFPCDDNGVWKTSENTQHSGRWDSFQI